MRYLSFFTPMYQAYASVMRQSFRRFNLENQLDLLEVPDETSWEVGTVVLGWMNEMGIGTDRLIVPNDGSNNWYIRKETT